MSSLTFEEKETLANENMSLIYFIANQFSKDIHEKDELVSAGFIGFTKALKTFDDTKRTKFSTYAYVCIKNEMLIHLRKEAKHQKCLSFQKIIADDGKGSTLILEDILYDEYEPTTEEKMITLEKRRLLVKLLERLTPTERAIMERRYGINGQTESTQTKTADLIGKSQASISKIEKRIRKKLRRMIEKEETA